MWALERLADERDGRWIEDRRGRLNDKRRRNIGRRQADAAITIIDVICLSIISLNGCCVLFVLLGVKIIIHTQCDCDAMWMSLKRAVLSGINYPSAKKHPTL